MTAASAPSPSDSRRRAAEHGIIVLATLAVLVALWLGRPVFVPLALSITVAAVLQPLVRALQRARLRAPAAAAVVVLASLMLLVGIGAALEQPVREMSAQLPRSLATARAKATELAAKARAMLGTSGRAPVDTAKSGVAAPPLPPASTVKSVFGVTASFTLEVVEEVLLVFFLLAAGDAWTRKLRLVARTAERAERWTSIAGEMHDVVTRYLWVTLLINVGQAIVIGLAVWAIGMPSPLLWAALTFIAEWVPYLGGLTMVALLLLTGLAQNQGVGRALLAPGAYLVVTTIQNNLVSPLAYGRGLRLNPTMILFGVMFWWMVWQVAGAFLAVPILAALHVLGSRIGALRPLGIVLEE